MKVQDQFGKVLTVSDSSADRWIARGYRAVEDEATAPKATAKRASSKSKK